MWVMGLWEPILWQCWACIKVWVISAGHASVRTQTLALLGLCKGMGHQCRSWVCENTDFGSAGPV